MTRSAVLAMVLTCTLCAAAGCSKTPAHAGGSGSSAGSSGASSGSASSGSVSGWIANGATACDKYLTPSFVGQIFKNPAGHSKRLSAQSCSFETPDSSSIDITLIAAGPAGFDAHQQYLANPVPLSGVGDRAVRHATGIEAIKGADRMCDIDVVPPFGNKLSGEALAHKIGEICNRLFAAS